LTGFAFRSNEVVVMIATSIHALQLHIQ